MTKRRLTEAAKAFAAKRAEVLSRVDASYVASAPFVSADRITGNAALSRFELFKKVQDILGAIVECGVYEANSLMLYMHLSMILEPYAINRSIIGFARFRRLHRYRCAARSGRHQHDKVELKRIPFDSCIGYFHV